MISKKYYQYHLRTNIHKSNCLLATEFENVQILTTAFKNRVITYSLKAVKNIYLTPEEFLYDNEKDIYRIIEITLQKHKNIKIQFELFAYYSLPKTGEKQLKSFITKYEIICNKNEIRELFTRKIIDTLKNKFSEFEHCESGW